MAGNKLSCVFVHGWGMNREIWQPVIEVLPDWINPVCVDLPGHGARADTSFATLEDLVESLDNVIEEPAIWVGWSLGGLAVLKLALLKPEKVKAILLVASSPRFVEKQDWPCGMNESVFNGFADEFEKDFAGTIKRFLTLQVKGSESGRQILKTLRKKVLQQPPANRQALDAGLNLLKSVDLRAYLHSLAMPVTWILGQQDGLIKQTANGELKKLIPDANIHVIEKAAHAPFLSHRDLFNQHLISLAQQVI